MKLNSLCIVAVISLTFSACHSDSTDLDAAKLVLKDGSMHALDPETENIARLAAAVLAEELNVPPSGIEVDSVRVVEWRDTSMGCPQPGAAYGQIVTPGYKITLRVDGQFHTVHEANGKAFVCRTRKDPDRMTGQIDLVWGLAAMTARSDLAKRLGTDEQLILITGARETTFSDASLDCPEPGIEYSGTPREGFVLTLRHGNRNYSYHTDLDRTIPCPAISDD